MESIKQELAALFENSGVERNIDEGLTWSMMMKKKMVEALLIRDGEFIVGDIKEAALANSVLKNIDSVILKEKALKTEEKNNENMHAVALSLVQNRGLLLSNESGLGEIVNLSDAELDDSKVPDFEYIDGENEVNPKSMDWNTFSKEYEEANNK